MQEKLLQPGLQKRQYQLQLPAYRLAASPATAAETLADAHGLCDPGKPGVIWPAFMHTVNEELQP